MTLASAFECLPAGSRATLRDRNAYTDLVAQTFGRMSMAFTAKAPDFAMDSHLVDTGDVAITRGFVSDGHEIAFEPMQSYAQIFLLRGQAETQHGRHQGRLSERFASVLPAGERFTTRRAEDTELVSMRIRAAALISKLGALLGDRPPGKCRFEADSSVDTGIMRAMQSAMSTLIHQHFCLEGRARDLIVHETQQSIIVAFLFANPHGFSEALARSDKDPARWQVRLSEQFIEANWDEALTIEKLVELTGTSARSLFSAFNKARGYSPMVFLRRVRLRKAHESLSDATATPSVTEVAYSCGFGNLGHFARAYQEAFGELPSETLSKSRGVARLKSPQGLKPN